MRPLKQTEGDPPSGSSSYAIHSSVMSFCEHCEGQRFDRAQVLRLLRATRKNLNKRCSGDEALRIVIKAVKEMDIPHMERLDEIVDGEVIH
jgi:hypothetical protein